MRTGLLLLTFALFCATAQAEPPRMARDQDVYVAPDAGSRVAARLSAGDSIRVLEQSDTFTRIDRASIAGPAYVPTDSIRFSAPNPAVRCPCPDTLWNGRRCGANSVLCRPGRTEFRCVGADVARDCAAPR